MTGCCSHCGATFERKSRGRPRKWCKGACAVAAWRASQHEQVVLTAAELACRRGIDLEAAAAHLTYFESVGLAERENGGWRPTDRGREFGSVLDEWARSLEAPLTDKDRLELRSSTGPARGARPRELGAA